jgi:hypothetical protein
MLQVRRRILIVCEGAKTEKLCFHAARRELRLTGTTIEIIGGDECGTAPKSIVEYAKEMNKQAKRKREPFDATWCVFDRDDHLKIHEATQQAAGNGYEVAFSNPSFELWFLLHFQEQSAHIERDIVLKELRGYLPRYEKGVDVYDELRPHQHLALERSPKLRDYHMQAFEPPNKNPSTTVDKLVNYLHSQKTA